MLDRTQLYDRDFGGVRYVDRGDRPVQRQRARRVRSRPSIRDENRDVQAATQSNETVMLSCC